MSAPVVKSVPKLRQVVVWSGGADSTMLLTEQAYRSSREDRVLAITVDRHPQISKLQLDSQRAAQKRYLQWAKSEGMYIEHMALSVVDEGKDFLRLSDGAGQSAIWVSHIAPYFPARCLVSFGYIKNDEFWHYKHDVVRVLEAMQALVRGDWTIDYPYEWSTKGEVLRSLRGWKVPDNCWWSCEAPMVADTPCGVCKKCDELRASREDERKRDKIGRRLNKSKKKVTVTR